MHIYTCTYVSCERTNRQNTTNQNTLTEKSYGKRNTVRTLTGSNIMKEHFLINFLCIWLRDLITIAFKTCWSFKATVEALQTKAFRKTSVFWICTWPGIKVSFWTPLGPCDRSFDRCDACCYRRHHRDRYKTKSTSGQQQGHPKWIGACTKK